MKQSIDSSNQQESRDQKSTIDQDFRTKKIFKAKPITNYKSMTISRSDKKCIIPKPFKLQTAIRAQMKQFKKQFKSQISQDEQNQ